MNECGETKRDDAAEMNRIPPEPPMQEIRLAFIAPGKEDGRSRSRRAFERGRGGGGIEIGVFTDGAGQAAPIPRNRGRRAWPELRPGEGRRRGGWGRRRDPLRTDPIRAGEGRRDRRLRSGRVVGQAERDRPGLHRGLRRRVDRGVAAGAGVGGSGSEGEREQEAGCRQAPQARPMIPGPVLHPPTPPIERCRNQL